VFSSQPPALVIIENAIVRLYLNYDDALVRYQDHKISFSVRSSNMIGKIEAVECDPSIGSWIVRKQMEDFLFSRGSVSRADGW
jgi:hypothetical protein